MCETEKESSLKRYIEVMRFLIDKATDEIETYRKRQITMFREAVIVLAFITWGVNKLLVQTDISGWIIRSSISVACLLISIYGTQVIFLYKKRIYFVRDQRADLTELIQKQVLNDEDILKVFYSTDNKDYNLDKGEESNSEKTLAPSSLKYSIILIFLGVLACIVNIVAGFATKIAETT